MAGILTIRDTVSLGVIVDAATSNAKVARYIEDLDRVVYGIARSIGDTKFNFLASGDDVRDAWLRVTTQGGMDVAWPVSELMDEVNRGEFAEVDEFPR